MGGIYDVERKGFRGGQVNYTLVTIGAHDGNRAPAFISPAKVRKSEGGYGFQFKSWYDPGLMQGDDGYNVIGQIFFRIDDRVVDGMTDRVVLDFLASIVAGDLQAGKRVDLAFVGYADPSGAAGYNAELSKKRARAVETYLAKKLRQKAGAQAQLLYHSEVIGRGEEACTMNPSMSQKLNYAANRRVDIVWRGQSFRLPELPIVGDYTGPLTNKLLFRCWGGGGFPVKAIVGADFVEIEIKSPYDGRRAWYTYAGGNIGLGVPISFAHPTSDYDEKEIPWGFADIFSFGGGGGMNSAMIGGGAQMLTWDNAQIRSPNGKFFTGLQLTFAGWDLQIGASMGRGYWSLMPYRTEAERDRYIAAQNAKRIENPSGVRKGTL